MRNAARSASLHRRRATRQAIAHVLAVATVVACGGSTAPNIIETPPVDTSTLVGTWAGTLDGGTAANSYGSSGFTMTLKADSTFAGKADNPRYCDLTATTWRVSAGQFSASGRDCDGVIVTFAAPVAPLRLTGTWTASSGRAGTFTLAKQ